MTGNRHGSETFSIPTPDGPLVDQRHQRFRQSSRRRLFLLAGQAGSSVLGISPKSLTNGTDQRWSRRCHRSRRYIVIEGKEQRTVDVHCDKVITIDTSPVGTIDFNLTDIDKQFLLRVGKAAALTFLHARNFDDGPCEAKSDGEVIPLIHHQFRLSYFIQIQKSSRLKVIGCRALYPRLPPSPEALAPVCMRSRVRVGDPRRGLHSWGLPA